MSLTTIINFMNNYTEEFEALWSYYPKRIGNNPKRKAYHAYNARVKQGYDHNSMINGLKRYCVFCEKTGIINTSYVMHASTFLGLDENFLEDWEPPKPEIEIRSDFPNGFDPSRHCGAGESLESCKIRAWREHERR